MAYESGTNPFNPMIIGAVAVIVALVAFLAFREGDGTSRQAVIQSPPATTFPAPTPTAPPAAAPVPTNPGAQ